MIALFFIGFWIIIIAGTLAAVDRTDHLLAGILYCAMWLCWRRETERP